MQVWTPNTTELYSGQWNARTQVVMQNNSTDFLNKSGIARPPAFKLPWGIYPAIEAAQIASILCLLATVFVYRRLPEFRNLPGHNLVTLCICLIITYALIFVDFVYGSRIRPNKPICVALASLTHLMFLAVFAWTSVMAYDIWHTVSRTHRPTSNSVACGKEANLKRYRRYALCAWTVTVAVALPPLIQSWGKLDWSPTLPKPLLGMGRCWLNGKQSFLVYFNAPVGAALIANMVFFILTARTMVRIRNMTDAHNIRQDRQRFHLYLKLFLVMGFIWIIEFLPLVTGVYILYAVAGFLTSLYGVAFFVIFVCKAKVWKSLRNTPNLFCCWRKTTSVEWNTTTRGVRLPSRTTLSTSLSNVMVENAGGRKTSVNNSEVLMRPV